MPIIGRNQDEFGNVGVLCHKKKDVKVLHRELGHPNEVVTRKTAKKMKIPLQGVFSPCEDCAVGKAKQKRVSKIPA